MIKVFNVQRIGTDLPRIPVTIVAAEAIITVEVLIDESEDIVRIRLISNIR